MHYFIDLGDKNPSSAIPKNWLLIGTIVLRNRKYPLLERAVTGLPKYCALVDGGLERVDGRWVALAKGTLGRPKNVHIGLKAPRSSGVVLDERCRAIAERLGDGVVSAGVRRALLMADGEE